MGDCLSYHNHLDGGAASSVACRSDDLTNFDAGLISPDVTSGTLSCYNFDMSPELMKARKALELALDEFNALSRDGADAQYAPLAMELATQAHRGQLDKAGQPYINHPRRVAETCTGDLAKAVAWLHDVIEDTPVSADDLREAGFSAAIVQAVELLTRTKQVPADEYYRLIRSNQLALQVKLADVWDNTQPWRLEQISAEPNVRMKAGVTVAAPSDRQRLIAKYLHALDVLGIYPAELAETGLS